MSSKKLQKSLFDIGGQLRKFKYSVQNFFHYRLLVNTKHLLIVGGSTTKLGSDLVDNFKNTWRIANIDFQANPKCDLNIQLDPTRMITKEEIIKISEQIKEFSQHFETIACLSDIHTSPMKLEDEGIFQAFEEHKLKKIQLNLIAGHLASKVLISNGLFLTLTDRNNFQKAITNDVPRYITNSQIDYYNLVLGDREDLDIDSISIGLMLNKIGVPKKEPYQPKWKISQQIHRRFNQPKIPDSEILLEKNEFMDEIYSKQVVNTIRKWGENQNRPISGSFATFNREGDIIYPVFL